MRYKSKAFDKFKEFQTEKQLGKNIKQLRFDQGGEYLLGAFKDYLSENGILSWLSAFGCPQKNGVAIKEEIRHC